MAEDKKEKGLMLLLSKKPSKAPKDEDEGVQGDDGDDESGDDLEAVAQDLIDAVDGKDASAVADALRAAFDCCHGDMGE